MKHKKGTEWFDNKLKEMEFKFSDYLNVEKDLHPRRETLKIIALYILMGIGWIYFSDKLLGLLEHNPEVLSKIQTYKGWLYVFVTGYIFYIIVNGKITLFKRALDKIYHGYEELSSAHEELLAMEEELTQQFDELEKHRNALMISDQRYQLAVEGANDGIWDWDILNDTFFFSIKKKAVFGYQDSDLPNTYKAWEELLHPEDREKADSVLDLYLLSKSETYENTYRLRCKNGEYRWILSRGKAIWNDKGQAVRMAGSHTDITEIIELHKRLRQEKELSENIINDALTIILVIDKNRMILKFNPFAEKITGYSAREVIGRKWSDIFIPEEKKADTDEIIERVLSGEIVRSQENQIITKEGRRVDILWNNNVISDEFGNILGLVATGLDITERRAMEEKLFNLAFYDTLTGLPNRQMFEKVLKESIDLEKEKQGKFVFLYLDIDNFKNINDTFGHSYGDKIIQEIAYMLQSLIKPLNNVARLGGDEFGIILSGLSNPIELHTRIISIMQALNRIWLVEGNELYISSSVGVVIYPQDGQDAQTLLKNGDTAMYVAKENNKNCYAFYTPDMNEKSLKYLAMERDLRNAIANNEFTLHYQPLIDLESGDIVGVEALVRWVHPVKGLIPPLDFIPFAEETGLIVEIGERVIRQACSQLKEWSNKGCCNCKISINLSARQLRQYDLIEKVTNLIETLKINGNKIVIEITENIALFDLNQSIRVLNRLKELGIQIALDDFGTGYSSLNYLKRLPVDIIKMDKSFVKDICNYPDEKYIAKTVIDLAHNMNLRVTAEGIETEEQLETLKSFGCDTGQGYYYSKPIPPGEVEELLVTKKKFLS